MRASANKQSRRVYNAAEEARAIRETFADRPAERMIVLQHGWPTKLQNVGDSLAVAYGSDKWKPKRRDGTREIEAYKHLAESRNRAFVKPGFLRDISNPAKPWPVAGRYVQLAKVPMPQHFAVLGDFIEADLELHPHGDEPDIVKVTVEDGVLGASVIRWSEVGLGEDEPFLFVYTPRDGIFIVIAGEELDIEKDGIVG